MVTLNLREEPTGEQYAQLVTWAAKHCSEFRCVTYDRWPLRPPALALMDRLKPHLLREELVMSWPGTELGEGWSARLWHFRVTDELVREVVAMTNGMFDWGGDLPEDPHFTREDGSVLLASTSSERDVWMELTNDEAEQFASRAELAALPYQ